MVELKQSEMIKAMRSSDKQYDGRFYVGVITTGIYCLPSCPARLPLIKNVRFFKSREDAIGFGLRGCKRCHSDSYPDCLPEWVPKLIKFMLAHPKERLTEQLLEESANMDISTIRRHFKREVNQTPLSFHRKLRLQQAKTLLDNGSDYLTVAYECGWESVSGFRDAYSREFGVTPGGNVVI